MNHVARAACGHLVFIMSDAYGTEAERDREVGRCHRLGLKVERITDAQVRASTWCPNGCLRQPGALTAVQGVLL